MPCCNLSEFRTRVPLRFMLLGLAIFWGTFTMAFLIGLLLVALPVGRGILQVLFEFLRALWHETMRTRCSTPARWSCRVSGVLLRVAPSLAGLLCRRPEIPLAVAGLAILSALAGIAWIVVVVLARTIW